MATTIVGQRFALLPGPPRLGGTATVHKARDLQTDSIVALKLFDGANLEDHLLQEIFSRDREALAALSHPNIVKLIEAGYDSTTNKYFIALEWVDQLLPQYLKENPPHDWDIFCNSMLVPLLSGLAEAHTRQIIHRDIKPSNILVDPHGQPKLADFGIAKIIASTRQGFTVREFKSIPFSPPDCDNTETDPRNDLFSLGVTILDCLRADPDFVITHSNLEEALRTPRIDDAARAFVARLVAKNPEDRPFNAVVALAELRRLQSGHPSTIIDKPKYHLFLHPNVYPTIQKMLGVRSLESDELQRAIYRDLSETACLSPHQNIQVTNQLPNYKLLGKELYYILTPMATGEEAQAVLVISQAFRPEPWQIENLRQTSLSIVAEFSFSPPLHPSKARSDLQSLFSTLAEHEGRRKQVEVDEEERELFQRWKQILRAKKEIEFRKVDPLQYLSFKLEGHKAIFQLAHAPSEDLKDQFRCVKTRQHPVCGTVEDVVDNELTLFVQSGDATIIPPKGSLKFEVDTSVSAIKRQEKALAEIESLSSARIDLKSLLVHPEKAQLPTPVPSFLPFQALDNPKQAAIKVALGSPDFTVVQGPPGTGKTTWISELICQFVAQNPGKRVILSAQTHTAVDNALEKVRKIRPDLRIVRVGNTDKIAESVEQYRIQPQMNQWAYQVKERSEEFLRGWAEVRGINSSKLALGDKVEALEQTERHLESLSRRKNEIEKQQEYADDLREQMVKLESEVWSQADQIDKLRTLNPLEDVPVLLSTADAYIDLGLRIVEKLNDASLLKEKISSLRRATEDAQIHGDALEETRKALRSEIAVALNDVKLADFPLPTLREAVHATVAATNADIKQLSQLQNIQQNWLLQFGHGEGFEKALISVADVVAGTCIGIASAGRIDDTTFDLAIIDEASKATPTEALVAMTRANQWVLVGDQNQLSPFADEELRDDNVIAKYGFTRQQLEETLFDRLIFSVPKPCQPGLTVQHRMLKPIGDLISHCFYDKGLETSPTVDQEEKRQIIAQIIAQVLPKSVTWYSTSALSTKGEREERNNATGARSYVNSEEANRIDTLLEELKQHANRRNLPVSVGIISGYTAQKNFLARQIDPQDKQKWQSLSIEINSVDAFQGREVDIVIYSVTRSNKEGKLGFLSSMKRLNVALSRGRDALVIFGDSEHCYDSPIGDNPFRKVLDYFGDHKASCCLEKLDV